jgi:L-ascorbate metabolism protein UlaG (beta-lactamase superfamily)
VATQWRNADRPPARIDGAAWRISYVGHASWLIQTAGFNMLLDPVWSKHDTYR